MKVLNKTAKSLLTAVPAFLTLSGAVFAAATGQLSKPVPTEVTPFQNIGVLLGQVFSFVLVIASILLFLYLILGGVQWLTSGGDKAATQAARDRITAALTGLLIILAVWGVFRVLEAAFGISVLSGIKLPSGAENPGIYESK